MLIDILLMLLVLLPLLTAACIKMFAGQSRLATVRISISGLVLTFAAASALLFLAVGDEPSRQLQIGTTWGSLLFDPLSSLMAFVISGISLIVHLYSRRYMIEESGYSRFFIMLALMTAALLLMVSAADLVSMLIAWHAIGILLYFLLGQDTSSHAAHRYASWTLLTYRFGDFPLLIAAILLYQAFDTWSLQTIFAQLQQAPEITTIFGLPLAGTVAGLIALSAFARSAQFLLHAWLPYSMSGPTPVSALMHAGIVNAGGFIINRFAPVFVHTDSILHVVFVVGLFTAVIGSVLMLAQNDIKKALGYSTMGQMGFMVMECGIGAFSLAIYHLIAHGLFKGTLFLGAGGVINQARLDDGVPKDELYTFVVERQSATVKRPWLLMAAVTLIVPVIILIVSHILVANDYFHKQGAVVLLFFGWVTGAQLIFVTYRLRTENIWRLMGLILISFTIVVLGYAFISHAFDLFLYPDPVFRNGIYEAAGIDIVWFDSLVIILTLMVVFGWIAVFYSEQNDNQLKTKVLSIRQSFYALLAREFFVLTLYRNLSMMLLNAATRLNVISRWS